MNSNEPIHHTDEPAELPDVLKQALREAYPDPKGQIAAQVMAQIRTEREEAERKRRTDTAERRRRRHGLVMKYGGMAACMVILSGALVLASPLMGRSADNAVPEMEYAAEDAAAAMGSTGTAAADSADAAEPRIALYSVQADDAGIAAYSDEEEAEETTRLTASSSQSQTAEIETEPAPANKMVKLCSLNRAPDDNAADAALPEAASAGEAESNEAYLLSLFTAGLLTEEAYSTWMTEKGYTDAEDWTKEELCEAFGIDQK